MFCAQILSLMYVGSHGLKIPLCVSLVTSVRIRDVAKGKRQKVPHIGSVRTRIAVSGRRVFLTIMAKCIKLLQIYKIDFVSDQTQNLFWTRRKEQRSLFFSVAHGGKESIHHKISIKHKQDAVISIRRDVVSSIRRT